MTDTPLAKFLAKYATADLSAIEVTAATTPRAKARIIAQTKVDTLAAVGSDVFGLAITPNAFAVTARHVLGPVMESLGIGHVPSPGAGSIRSRLFTGYAAALVDHYAGVVAAR